MRLAKVEAQAILTVHRVRSNPISNLFHDTPVSDVFNLIRIGNCEATLQIGIQILLLCVTSDADMLLIVNGSMVGKGFSVGLTILELLPNNPSLCANQRYVPWLTGISSPGRRGTGS